jgi:uncharacterized protein YciI
MSTAQHWIYLTRLVRPGSGMEPRPEEEAIFTDHFNHLKSKLASGELLLAGPCEDTSFGVVIFTAPGEDEAQAFMTADPAIARGLMTGELHAFRVSLLAG